MRDKLTRYTLRGCALEVACVGGYSFARRPHGAIAAALARNAPPSRYPVG